LEKGDGGTGDDGNHEQSCHEGKTGVGWKAGGGKRVAGGRRTEGGGRKPVEGGRQEAGADCPLSPST
jgi:hypothetical protein